MQLNKLYRFVKNLIMLACVGICIWCVADSFENWAQEQGLREAGPPGISGKFLSFAPKAEEEGNPGGTPSPSPQSAPVWTENGLQDGQLAQGGQELGLPDDGVVPFHSDLLPGISATPDPNRTTGTVEEILIDGGAQVDTFFVRDSTESGTDLEAELLEPTDLHIKADGSVEVLIYHTHTSESYSQSAPGFYYTDMETRTQNQDQSVVAAGEALAKALESQGIGVVHDKTVNDTAFNGSYSRSWEVIQKNLNEHPGIQVTIDVHRDSMTTEEGIKYKPTAEIGGRKAAQAMLLAGCDADGSWGDFPDWRQNLRLILRTQKKAQELYPGLMRPMNFSNSKYNMNATTGSMLIEVGTEVNTVSEARYTGSLLGEIIAETLKSLE